MSEEYIRESTKLGTTGERPTGTDRVRLMFTQEANREILNPQEYNAVFRKANQKQREVLMYHRRWLKETVIALNEGRMNQGYCLFLSGPGRVGKSLVTEMLKTDTIRLLRNARDISQEDTVILLTASTGVAAFNIGGSTVHSVLQIHEMSEYEPLEGDKANTVIMKLDKLHVVIIDEASMIRANLLYIINPQAFTRNQKDEQCKYTIWECCIHPRWRLASAAPTFWFSCVW